MNETYRNEQIKQFLGNQGMSNAVKQFILDVFLEKRTHQDIYEAAAERIAIDLLITAYGKMEIIKNMQTEIREKNLSHV